MRQRLHRRLMFTFAGFTLLVSAVFGLSAMAFVYTVEDRFLDRLLQQEAQRQRSHHAAQGRWGPTGSDFISLHTSTVSLPADLARLLAVEPRRTEVAGDDGRHYHLLALQARGQAPWLVAEVSQQLIVRPMRQDLLGWLAGFGGAMVVVALGLAWVLARRVSAPLERLAAQVAAAGPEALPTGLAAGLRDDEVGALAQGFDALLARTRDFIAREQAFTRDASHELRTPLTVLRMAIERLQTDATLTAEVHKRLRGMHTETQLMHQSVETLLLLAREAPDSAAAPAAPVAVLALVEQWVLSHAQALDAQGLRLDLQLQRHDTLALPVPVLQLALASLLGNACTHGQRGGCIGVHLSPEGLCISNPGPPLPAGAGTAGVKGEASEGHGLGLSIVARLLQRHGSALQLRHLDGRTEALILHPACASH